MLDKFLQKYVASVATQTSVWSAADRTSGGALQELADEAGGTSFNGGVYRLHSQTSGPIALENITLGLPEFENVAMPFAFDWLGRQYSFDKRSSRQDSLLIFDPSLGDILEVPCGFEDFHESILVKTGSTIFNTAFLAEWREANDDFHEFTESECVGYRIPPFLGGSDDIDNYELQDIDVYWSIMAQLFVGTSGLPAGSPVTDVSIEPVSKPQQSPRWFGRRRDRN